MLVCNMNASQKVNCLTFAQYAKWWGDPDDFTLLESLNSSNIDEIFNRYTDDGELDDAINEVRCTGTATNLPTEYSRHYECYEVAMRALDGSWVGWTYWYGGGKHGRPEEIDWINYAYDVSVTEQVVTKTEYVFTKF